MSVGGDNVGTCMIHQNEWGQRKAVFAPDLFAKTIPVADAIFIRAYAAGASVGGIKPPALILMKRAF